MLSSLLVASTLAGSALAQSSFVPLAAKRFDYNNLPYQADNGTGIRGTQVGYNRCNSTTEGAESMCQTAIINSIDEVVGDVEGEMVAWCTKDGHGTRIIPEGAIQGVQFMRTPHYVQVVGFIDQAKINIAADDYGGEMDVAEVGLTRGYRIRMAPISVETPSAVRFSPPFALVNGRLIFSNAFSGSTSTNGTTANGTMYQQIVQWHNFMGGSTFCLKACDPDYELGYAMCEHIFDRIGCKYNAPANYPAINGTFESCLGDDQLYPGVYVGSDGATSTYTQPPESLGVITTIPYEPFTPSSSSCTPYTSANIYTAAPTIGDDVASAFLSQSTTASTTVASSTSAASTGSGSGSGSLSATSQPTATGAAASNAASASSTSAAETNR
ncbi:SPOSA6832_04270 [Sporobolomyces salmonicolor]|uniref:SPOSA6832_04270-mRNA-1:cds n=1 Tax=Sporidiobolus salmonicolor TaxID=5005 RepID=A0A0D6ER78_SPOSA|nr:SPOSA6832_04270 [Sporobolomyces salmonicolor]